MTKASRMNIQVAETLGEQYVILSEANGSS